MNVAGIIAEYNPFHNGHKYHIEKTKAMTNCDVTVCVMSGNFMQRGELALIDKYHRAQLAIKSGADLVLLLPFVYACNSVDLFAQGSVNILSGLGVVNYLSFGSENGDIGELMEMSDAAMKLDEEIKSKKNLIKAAAKSGVSYPRAREMAIREILENKDIQLNSPNDILAVSYLKSLKSLNLKNLDNSILPITIKRFGSGVHDIEKNVSDVSYAGATAIRDLIIRDGISSVLRYIPTDIYSDLENYYHVENISNEKEIIFSLIKFLMIREEKQNLLEIYSSTEGLSNRLYDMTMKFTDLDELMDNMKTKRYTYTRIRRLLIHTLIGLKKSDMQITLSNSPYTRVLAANEKGRKLLRYIKKNELNSIPIIVSESRDRENLKNMQTIVEFEKKADRLYYHIKSGKVFKDIILNQSPFILGN